VQIRNDTALRVGEMGCGEVAEGRVKWRALVWFCVCAVLRTVGGSVAGMLRVLIQAAAQ
jgi:hypothetical protein